MQKNRKRKNRNFSIFFLSDCVVKDLAKNILSELHSGLTNHNTRSLSLRLVNFFRFSLRLQQPISHQSFNDRVVSGISLSVFSRSQSSTLYLLLLVLIQTPTQAFSRSSYFVPPQKRLRERLAGYDSNQELLLRLSRLWKPTSLHNNYLGIDINMFFQVNKISYGNKALK